MPIATTRNANARTMATRSVPRDVMRPVISIITLELSFFIANASPMRTTPKLALGMNTGGSVTGIS